MDGLRPPEPVDFKASSLGSSWLKWKQQFEIYYLACELDKKPKATQVAILLHAAGPEAQEIAATFSWGASEDKENYKQMLEKFTSYCEPRKNVVFERYEFWNRDQKESEPVDTWVTDLRNKATKCEFGDQTTDLLRDKIVFGVRDISLKERLLREPKLSLDKALDICRAVEISKFHIRAMTDAKDSDAQAQPAVNLLRHRSFPRHPQPEKVKAASRTQLPVSCHYCGQQHERDKCPAFGQQCSKCHGYNHFAPVCQGGGFRRTNARRQHQQPRRHKRGKPIHTLQRQNVNNDLAEDVDNLYIGTLFAQNKVDKWQETLVIGNRPINFKLDTGADANVIPLATVEHLGKQRSIKPSTQPLRAFGGSKVMPVGTVDLVTCCPSTSVTRNAHYYVAETTDIPILGKQSCEEFKLVQRTPSSLHIPVHAVTGSPVTKSSLLSTYADVFSGLGKYDQPYHIVLDPAVLPVIQRCRRVPLSKLEPLKTALEKLQEQGVIADVDKPTDWVHNLVITEKKNGNLRLCLDPKPLNEAIKRERHNIPTVEDVLAQLSGKRIFTVVDMRDSYWHVELDEESSYMCTFHTPWGRKRFLRMPFGISSASEVMQKRNEQTFSDIAGVHVIADDIIIASSTEAEHDATLHKLFERAQQRGIKFNAAKLQLKLSEVQYMGNIVTADGLRPCPKKTDAIINMPTPTDRPSLMRFLGMVKFLSSFLPDESTLTAPLRGLLKKDVPWYWEHEHDKAVSNIKAALARPTTLHFFDPAKPAVIQTDSSQSGLGSCLLQCARPVAYASRALTAAEQNYSQIEKELLAICFACSKFHQYTYGRHVEVHTDHKPLQSIFNKPLGKAAPRLQRMLLQLQRYTLTVKYVPGRFMYVADALSRAYLPDDTPIGAPEDMEVMVHELVDSLPISSAKRAVFQKATSDDPVMQQLRSTIRNGWPKSIKAAPSSVRPYWNVRDELHEADGLLLKTHSIIVPSALRPQMLALIHEGHLGIDKCRARARQVMFWPGMSQDISDTVAQCNTCQTLRATQQKEPLMSHEMPRRPWQKLAADIMTLDRHDYLVVADYFSKFPEVARLERKTAACVIMHLKSIFARHGIPNELCTDNMPFASSEFRQFANDWDFKLTTSSPEYPQSNGQAERTVQTVKQLLRKAQMCGKDPYLAMLEYRAAPVAGLQYSPAQILMGRQIRGRLPVTARLLKPTIVNVRHQLVRRQADQKKQYDKAAKSLKPLHTGDPVRVRREGRWEPATVIQVLPHRSYVVSVRGTLIRRNRRHLLAAPPGEKSRQQPAVPLHDYIDFDEPANPVTVEPDIAAPQQAPVVNPPLSSRPTRAHKAPSRFDDYEMA